LCLSDHFELKGQKLSKLGNFLIAVAALQENRCMKDLKAYLLAVCGDKGTKKQLKLLLKEKASTVGLLVYQREYEVWGAVWS
jgi:hypothetical protein